MFNMEVYTPEEEKEQLVALLTWLFPSSIEKGTVVIDTPAGNFSWRIENENAVHFKHLPREMGRKAPVRSDKEKYELLQQLGKRIGGIIIALGMLSGIGDK